MYRYVLLIVISFILHGCFHSSLPTPSIQDIVVENNIQGSKLVFGQPIGIMFGGHAKISARIFNPGINNLTLTDVKLAYRSTLDDDSPLIQLGKMDYVDGRYTHQFSPLNYGPYVATITARFRPFDPTGSSPVPGPDTIITANHNFFIQASNECFEFDNTDESWTFQGVFNANTGEQIASGNCPAEINNAAGQIVVNTGQQCFPIEVQGSEFWRFDFVSPELGTTSSWQNISGAVINISTTVPVQVQPILTYQTEDGNEISVVEADSGGEEVFHPLPLGFNFTNLYPDLNLPAGATAVRFRVRVFGRPIDTVSSGDPFVAINHICPIIRNRPRILEFPVGKKLPLPPSFQPANP